MSLIDVTTALEQVEASSAGSRAQGYSQLLDKIFHNPKAPDFADNLTEYVFSLTGESVGIVSSRPLLASVIERLEALNNPSLDIDIGLQIVSALEHKVASYEEQDTHIKKILASAYERREDFRASAEILQRITLNSSQKVVTSDTRAEIWIRIVRCYLEENDPTSALVYLNRVKNILHDVQASTTRLQFQLSQARILDSQRNFLEASNAYQAFSNESAIDADERLQALSAAIVCAVLAPAGPARARLLARLYKDERIHLAEEHGILEKMFLDRLISPGEVRAFSEKLKPHHLATTSDGSTVLDRAVLEHNLIAASRLYENIAFESLGALLGVSANQAEHYAAQMIEQVRLTGHIDQIAQLLYFHSHRSPDTKTTDGAEPSSREFLRKWDQNVLELAEGVEKVTTLIQDRCPVRV